MTYVPNAANAPDPFDDFESCPALSFADAPAGTVYQGTITRLPRELHDRDMQTKQPQFWPDGQPKTVIVLQIEVLTPEGLHERSVWAKKPSSLYRALGQAQKESGAKFALGGTLAIKFDSTIPAKTPGFSPQKIYLARYAPPVTPDPFASTSATPTPAPAAASTPPVGGAAKPTW